MASPSSLPDPSKHNKEGEYPNLRPSRPIAPLLAPIEETDTPYKEVILSLPSDKRWPPFALRQYQGFWHWEGMLHATMAVQQHFAPRSDDIFIASLPKSGTTWLKALTFAIVNRSKYSFTSHPLLRLNPHDCVRFVESTFSLKDEGYLESLPSPRVLAFHMPCSALPHTVISSSDCRIVYIGREPKDVLVSLWHMNNNIKPEMSIPFDQAFGIFCEGKGFCGPVWDHMLEYWNESVRRPHKVLFLKYEEMVRETEGTLKRLAEFIGFPFSKDEEMEGVVENIIELCSFKRLKDLAVNTKTDGANRNEKNTRYFRKGVIGDWRNHMSLEMAEKLDEITKHKLQGSGLTF